MISTSEFRNGAKVEFKGDPYEIIDFLHSKMGRGGAIVKTKLKNLKTGSIIEETFKSGEKLKKPDIEEKSMQFLYKQEESFYFMDMDSYDQFPVESSQLGDARKFLKENMAVKALFFSGSLISVELPIFVELTIAQTDPGFKGDTASGGNKPAVLETGATVKVPFHLNEGDVIKVDTRTSDYIERVK